MSECRWCKGVGKFILETKGGDEVLINPCYCKQDTPENRIAALESELARCREALIVAKDAMEERRSYAQAWEWKYGEAWNEEDAHVRAALAGEGK